MANNEDDSLARATAKRLALELINKDIRKGNYFSQVAILSFFRSLVRRFNATKNTNKLNRLLLTRRPRLTCANAFARRMREQNGFSAIICMIRFDRLPKAS